MPALAASKTNLSKTCQTPKFYDEDLKTRRLKSDQRDSDLDRDSGLGEQTIEEQIQQMPVFSKEEESKELP